jgi:hypothetical protein
MATRRFPPPWRAERMPGGYVVRDANGRALAYVYSRSNEAEAMQAKVLTEDEARRVAANIAKLPNLLRPDGARQRPSNLFSFNGTDGANPRASLIADAAGDLFGTTSGANPDNGVTSGDGTVFELSGTGFQVLSGGGNSVNTPGARRWRSMPG